MVVTDNNTPSKSSIDHLSQDEKTEAALAILKDLNPLQGKADKDGFGFLAYLLRMAILEAQAIASGSNGGSENQPCDTDQSSY